MTFRAEHLCPDLIKHIYFPARLLSNRRLPNGFDQCPV